MLPHYHHLLSSLCSLAPGSPQLECAIDVVIDGPEIKTSWYQLWSAAASIVDVCASDNKDGVSTITGIAPFHLVKAKVC